MDEAVRLPGLYVFQLRFPGVKKFILRVRLAMGENGPGRDSEADRRGNDARFQPSRKVRLKDCELSNMACCTSILGYSRLVPWSEINFPVWLRMVRSFVGFKSGFA